MAGHRLLTRILRRGSRISRKGFHIQLIAQFRIFPSSESRHSFVANYTSAVILRKKKHILVLLCCIIIPLYVCEVIYLVKIITISPHDPFYEGIFSHVSVTVHCIFPKNAFV